MYIKHFFQRTRRWKTWSCSSICLCLRSLGHQVWISNNTNSDSNMFIKRSVTKAERTQIGFPENYRHIARFGKIRGQRGPHTYCYPKVKSVYKLDKILILKIFRIWWNSFFLLRRKCLSAHLSGWLNCPQTRNSLCGRFSGSPATEDGTSAETLNTQKSI